MTDEMDGANIQAQYAAQFAADLEKNEKEQEVLRARLQTLETEHAWLSSMRSTVAGQQEGPGEAAGKPDRAAGSTETAGAVPRARRAKRSAASPGRRKKPAQAGSVGTEQAAPGARARKSDGPTLGELILGVLAQHGQPRMVSEIVKELGQAHPERVVSGPVVRSTVEALVAKGRLERERKQGSVFYTAPAVEGDAAPDTAGPAKEPEAEAATETTAAEA
ncbi:hypothetical protein FGW37_32730 [Streptomyces rectiverticillatus]|uniref:hypothetical protein n=1 Tax=Streptomyces rectiverticillatus TaxID=173860 RepID=UPI0015C34317|nr:hypothetical protein [Streptomyces rectiverticillatus]QLE75721.1 hypothetical protein FGW37_32730 [Streptomyces rectiverticillatus]